jgi:CHAT domain-containing protein/tetratricopeptide (TPR) repeat protein
LPLAVCLLSALALQTSHVQESSRMDRVLDELASYGSSRGVEPRLHGSAAYAAFRPLTSFGFQRLAGADRSLRLSVAQLTGQTTTAAGLERAGLAHLLLGDWELAVEHFTAAIRGGAGEDTRLELASAYYMRGVSNRSLEDFARALQSLTLVRSSPLVTFNRALILERLHAREAAAAEWRSYLTSDATSSWAEEARRHLQLTSQPRGSHWNDVRRRLSAAHVVAGDVAAFPLPSRHLLEAELLPDWAEATLRGDDTAAVRALASARAVAAALHDRGDRFFDDILDPIVHGDGPTRRRLATGFVAYRKGCRFLEATNYTRALAELRAAQQAFEETRNPATGLAAVGTITALYYTYDYEGAAQACDAAARDGSISGRPYIALFAHLDWLRGLLETVRGNPSDGLRSFERALHGFERLGETELMARQQTNLADTLQYLGDTDGAAVHRYQALALSDDLDDPRRLHPILSEAADASLAASMPAAALVFQDRLVGLARRNGDPLPIADALITRSTILLRNGNRNAALQDLGEAQRLAQTIDDPPARERIVADLGTAEALAWRQVDDRRAIISLTLPLQFFGRVGFRMHLAQLLLERGRARLRLGDTAGAEEDFRAGVAELEAQRRRVDDRELRISYFDRAERLFADLALSLLRRGNEREAFAVLERGHARELLDSATGKAMDPMSLPEIQRRLPPRTFLVAYTLTSHTLVTAVVTEASLRVTTRAVEEEAMAQRVEAIVRGFETQEGLPENELRLLAGELLPELRNLPAESRLVFIPDGALHRVPFAALPSRPGHFLVEDHPITIAPSATFFVTSAARARELGGKDPSVLLVASPERPRGFDSLQPLTQAAAEVGRIAPLYRHSQIVEESVAAGPLLALVKQHEVVHFAGHAVIDQSSPASSMLLIGATERLRAKEVEATRLSRTRLVVLGACSTAIGRAHRGEGILSLARSFMAASVPVVVGTQAPVEDYVSARLMVAFHRAYARHGDAATAMQSAQLEMMHGTDRSARRPANWAAFQVFGGTSPIHQE